jgi:hypothetical protein
VGEAGERKEERGESYEKVVRGDQNIEENTRHD